LNKRDVDDTSWWLKEVLLFPFMITGASRLYTKLRQSAVGVATSMTYDRYLFEQKCRTL